MTSQSPALVPAVLALISFKVRPVLTFPIRSTQTFPDREQDWPPNYPALIKPWIGGVRAFWLEELQAFQLQDGRVLRVDGIEPYVPGNVVGHTPSDLLGEFWEKGATYEETLANVVRNEPPPTLDFYIYDVAKALPAIDRALYCVNIPRQFERHTRIAEMYQVNTRGGFKTHLEGWRVTFLGALAVGYQDPWLSTEYEVKTLVDT